MGCSKCGKNKKAPIPRARIPKQTPINRIGKVNPPSNPSKNSIVFMKDKDRRKRGRK